MHCSKLYQLLAVPELNVLHKLSKDQYKEVRKHCIETILHTDMVNHQNMVNRLQMLYRLNSEVFAGSEGASSVDSKAPPEIEVFSDPDTKKLVMETILHSADVSNPCRAWEVTEQWAELCMREFFAQGDREKELGIPVQILNNRDTVNKQISQIMFIEGLIAPFFFVQMQLMPNLYEFGENVVHNIVQWESVWLQEASPSEEEVQKTRGRIEKVRLGLAKAKQRSPT